MTDTESSFEAAIKKEGLFKGIIWGVILLALNIFTFYYITSITKDPVMIFFGMGAFSFILPLAFSVVFTIQMRQKMGGFWSFRQAVRGVFTMLIVGYIIMVIGRDGIFANFVEPDMVTKTEKAIHDSERLRYKQQGLSEDKAAAKIAENEKQFGPKGKATVFSIVESYIITIILLFVLSLGFGLIFKRELIQPA